MVTPFHADGSLDLDGAQRLARWLLDHGNDGLVVAGTTGEAPTLTHDEQIDLVAAVVEAVDGDGAVVAGSGSNDTATAVSTTRRITDAGADAALVVTPYYNRPPQSGLDAHFRAVAAATDLPVMIYDIPGRTGRKVATETLLTLAREVDNVVALKDAAGDVGETASLLAQAPEGFEVYSGDDVLTLPLLSVGAVGTVGVATHWTGAEHQQMFAAIDEGDLAAATALNQRMLPSFAFETGDVTPNPIPTKAVLNLLGLPAGPCRPPMGPVVVDLADEARELLADLAVAAELGSR